MALSSGVWRVTMQAVTASDNNFKIAEADWAYEWTHGGWFPLATVVTAQTWGDNSEIDAVPGRYYTFAMNPAGAYATGQMIVQETLQPPAAIASVSQAVGELETAVSINTAAEPGAEERILVRYSLDGWTTSVFVEAAGAGTSWTAVVVHAAGEVGQTCAYEVLTTTVTEPSHAYAGLQALRLDDNGGGHYSYVVDGPEPETPTVQASDLQFSGEWSGGVTVAWSNGNGAGRVVVARAGVAVDQHPQDGVVYSAGSGFGVGSDLGGGQHVVHAGAGSSVAVTGLDSETTYHFRVYEFNGTGTAIRYNRDAATGNPASVLTPEPAPPGIHINEVLSSNTSGAQDEDGAYSDWVELYNSGPDPVHLEGWGLSDSYASPFKWVFGDVTLPSGEFLIVWASSKNRPAVTNGNPLHASFAISSGGEEILLTHPGGTRIDEMAPIPIPTDFSRGRQPDGTGDWLFFPVPTPGASNTGTGFSEVLDPPVFSAPGGMYTSAVSLVLSTDAAGAEIRYTLDGSEPTTNSALYEAALLLESRAGEPNNLSEIPTNNDTDPGPPYYEGWQPPAGEVFKFHTVRARVYQAGAMPSPAVTHSYVVDAAGTNRYSLPVVSIVSDAANFFDDDIGIYVPGWHNNMFQSGSAWERPGTIEFFEPGGTLAFRGDIGIRLHGNTTRSRPRKALRIYAKTPSTFEYPIFPDKPLAKFDTFILRNGGNDWGNGVFRDLYLQSLAADTELDRQYGRLVLVFLNGEYWGIHDLRERFDDGYAQNNHGLDEHEYVQVEMDNAASASPYVPVYDSGNPDLGGDYSNLWHYIATHDLSEAAHYAAVQDRLSVESFIDFFQANIFFGNTDWPGNNVRAWRSVATNRTEGAPANHDGRWRYMLYDADFGFGADFYYVPGQAEFAQHDTLSFAASPVQTHVPNPPDSTLMFRRLLENADFRAAFVTRFCDRLNTSYSREHVTNAWANWVAQAEPEMAEHVNRWRQPYDWSYERDRIRSYGEQRTEAVWGHVRNFFGLGAPSNLTLAVTNAAEGFIRVNTTDLDGGTAGFGGYPWTGAYFTNYPVTLTAAAREGYRFVEWRRDGVPAGTNEVLEASLAGGAAFEAVFAPLDAPETVLVHYWNFNDTANLLVPMHSLVGGAEITVQTGVLTVVTSGTGQDFAAENARFGDEAGAHLRLNDPIGATMDVALPTTGFEDIVVKYETRRSSSGAGSQEVSYTLDGSNYTALATIGVTEVPTVIPFSFADIPGADDNPDFGLRIGFAQGAGGATGNNRFDNWTAEGTALDDINLPPEVVAPIGFQEMIEGAAAATFNLSGVFSDPDGDPLTFGAESGDPAAATAGIAGSTLTVTPHQRGGAVITVTADDGRNEPVATTFRVLAYPAAHVLENGNFSFGEWDPDLPEKTYPDHMLFLQSDRNDTLLDTPLTYAYHIAHDDYHVNDAGTIGFPYNNTGRSRINGLNENGIAFINTGSSRDLGGALLALDTRGVSVAPVTWLGGTVLPNTRIYAIRLQYRVGATGDFLDVLDGEGQPVEYVRNASAGHSQPMGPTELPAEALGQEYVQVLWRYHLQSGTSGARAQLRLDDIRVANNAADPAVALEFGIEPPTHALSGAVLAPFTVRAVDGTGLADINYTGTITLARESGSGVLGGVTAVAAVAGVAAFDAVTITGSGEHTLRATGGALTAAVSRAILVDADPLFIPGGTAAWNNDDHWTSASYPNATGATAKILAPASAARNVDVNAPVTVGTLTVDNAGSTVRNRIRGQAAGNSLTFASGAGAAALNILGDGPGYVEFEIIGGVVLASDLAVAVENTAGDPEYGALRLRQAWTGPGGMTKTGPGMASLTGEAKEFSGPVVVQQGVLAVTQPSAPSNSSGTTVLSGGQVRLTSGGEEVRVYEFGGTVSLSGSGRSGVEEGEGLGVLGALRYEPGSPSNRAAVAGPVNIAGNADIHVAHESNRLELSGALTGTARLNKSGGGILVLGGEGSTYSGEIEIETGGLRVEAAVPTASVRAQSGTTVGGRGGIGGDLHLDAGARLAFHPAGPLAVGGTASFGGFGVADLEGLDAGTPAGTYVLLDGTVATGHVANIGPAQAVALGEGGKTAYFTEGLELVVAGGGGTPGYSGWQQDEFTPAEQADPDISGPLADPDETGVPNLLRYALGMGRNEGYEGRGPAGGWDEATGEAVLRHRRLLAADSGVEYTLEYSDDLMAAGGWAEVQMGNQLILMGAEAVGDGRTESVTYQVPTGMLVAPRFFRLRVVMVE